MPDSQRLRAWQHEAFELYTRQQPRDFLAVATPGAGKTTYALTIAADLLHRGIVERVVVVTPTNHLKTQWAHAASRAGVRLDPAIGGRGSLARDFNGFVVTYAGLASNPNGFRVRIEQRRTFVILDEIHHAGDALSWGDAVREACEPAVRRLSLTGTPFRSDDNPIPFVDYEQRPDGTMLSRADYSYGYGQALRDNVVRPVLFMSYSGQMRWRTRAGDEVEAHLGGDLTRDMSAQALRTALDPEGSWIPAVFEGAHRRLMEVRRHVPDAAGLVIASDQESARAYARVLAGISRTEPVVVVSDEPESHRRIAEFADGEEPWMIAVRMVSEGVDIPRLSVGVYATNMSTPLFFSQAVGRFVRARRRGETASVFLPSVPGLLALASDLERERDHVIGRPADDADLFDDEELQAAQSEEAASDELEREDFAALGSEARFDRVLYDGGEYGHEGVIEPGSDEELDFIGIPGLLEPSQVAELLSHARSRRSSTATKPTPEQQRDPATGSTSDTTFESRDALRRELNSLVGAWHHRSGQPHGVTHAQLRDATGGPPSAQASSAQLRERIDLIRRWATRPPQGR